MTTFEKQFGGYVYRFSFPHDAIHCSSFFTTWSICGAFSSPIEPDALTFVRIYALGNSTINLDEHEVLDLVSPIVNQAFQFAHKTLDESEFVKLWFALEYWGCTDDYSFSNYFPPALLFKRIGLPSCTSHVLAPFSAPSLPADSLSEDYLIFPVFPFDLSTPLNDSKGHFFSHFYDRSIEILVNSLDASPDLLAKLSAPIFVLNINESRTHLGAINPKLSSFDIVYCSSFSIVHSDTGISVTISDKPIIDHLNNTPTIIIPRMATDFSTVSHSLSASLDIQNDEILQILSETLATQKSVRNRIRAVK